MENCCSYFSNKNSKSDKIILNEEGKTVSDGKELSRTFCTYFANIISDLQIPKIHEDLSNIRSNHDPVLAAINTFAKLLKTSMLAKLVKVVTFLQKP